MRIAILGFLLLNVIHSFGQRSKQLGLEEFYQQVKENHPFAKQAYLLKGRSDLAFKEARGVFDPKLIAEYNTKQFQGKDYYDLWEAYVKVPTILNVEFKAGYERANGQFINEQNNLPEDGLYYAGFTLPIGQGLIHNPRNIERQRGEVASRTLKNDAADVFNNLMVDASFAYWGWYEAFQKLILTQSNLGLIQVRFEGTRESVLNGENAAMDSVETLIQLQQWSNHLRKATLDYQNSLLIISNFIWSSEADSLNLQPSLIMPGLDHGIEEFLDFAEANHPKLKSIRLKQELLDLDRKLSSEMLKPVLNLNYNIISGRNMESEYAPTLGNDYKGGFDFSFPIFIRKERAKLQQVKVKIQENEYMLDQQSRAVLNKVIQSYNKVLTLQELINQQEEMVVNYETLLTGERTKFDNGESSVFLVNSRENKKIDAQMKLIELQADYGRALGELDWASGRFSSELIGE